MAEREPDDAIERSAVGKMSWRILPLIALGYLVSYMDRVNISFAATRMNEDLGFSATVYGLGGGLFFLSYALFEIPSNLLLVRFGARRWIARIMITWGLIAAGMMFVRTPLQFYAMRLLLGFAEAGFFPGVIYYLSHWFPLAHRGRAISRFYMTGALAAAVMGGVAGWLLDLEGQWGLHGWQWLLLVEGLPAVVLGLIILRFLPDAPEAVGWLTDPEKNWIRRRLAGDAARIGEPAGHHLLAALRNPLVLQLALIGFLTIGSYIAFALSAPALLAAATGLDARRVGYLIGLGGILGVGSQLLVGWHSDRTGERFAYLIGSTSIVGVTCMTIALSTAPAIVIPAFLLFAAAWSSVSLSTWMVATDILHVRQLAVGSAAINSISQLGAFVAPFAWGVAKDATGSYRIGLIGLSAVFLCAVAAILILRRQIRGTGAQAWKPGIAATDP